MKKNKTTTKTTKVSVVPIMIWKYGESPYDALPLSNDDLDWVMLVPKNYQADYLSEWIATPGNPFGCCHVEVYTQDTYNVYFGYHA